MKVSAKNIFKWRTSNLFRGIKKAIEECGKSTEGVLFNELQNKDGVHDEQTEYILTQVKRIVEEVSSGGVAGRYGDPAFRTFHSQLEQFSISLNYPNEIQEYFLSSFGNPTRIDYGTGHEFSFFLFLISLSLYKHNKFNPAAIVFVFDKYISLVQHIQTKYKLEPAGSMGVWGLDDHQFLSFYFGASQLVGRVEFSYPSLPECFESDNIDKYSEEVLFFKSIKYVYINKNGSFLQHSPRLYNLLSTNHSWASVRKQLLMMYIEEVLIKHQAIQHVSFGNIISKLEEGNEFK